MALPKDPRQKMINIMYLVLTALLALNVSAEILNAFKVVEFSLSGSNNVLNESNKSIYDNFDQMLKDPKTSDKAAIWKPKADQVRVLAQDIYAKIESYKQGLKEESDLDKSTGDYKEDDIEAPTRYFTENSNGADLYQALGEFKVKLLAIDKDLAAQIGAKLPLNLEIPKSNAGNTLTGNKVTDWVNSYFHMTPTVAALTILSKFQNDVKNSENIAAAFCANQVGSVKLVLDKFEPLVGTSSNYLMPGEEMVVTAGLGAFNSNVKPVVTIDGRTISVNASGVAESKFSVGAAGTKTMNVTVSFIDPNTGEKRTVSKKVNYTIGTPSGVAASADKMNVLYIGVDNPLTITAGAGSEKVSAQFSGGTITKSGGSKYIVKPNPGAYGEQTVTVLVDGKPVGKVGFRVKQLPNPTAYVGNLRPGAVPSASFKAMGGVIAKLEDSEFDAPFEVVSYKIGALSADIPDYAPMENKGPRWSGAAAGLVNKLKPGALVAITEITVKDPAGRTRVLPSGLSYNLK
ncbi:MAG: gliding motility protein GldM [Bacteroidota bacterium]|jgi:gliding motility-associated protein GldM|nr:gliding motility protein GldM [Chitinophagia bacterium]